ncbi:ATP-binding protein [Streptomyces bohaiensis]|uniref:ATP-binding protein n=1 Tax=Streptomyces bohaiensis TaxID=1431344 RepID=A0ABX1CDQ8_9ACTN|nr:ATP-binding protein [Streptomyces bohaiensis]NJQ15522.1 ATP-binding protein [Streptomyces bohaiensis]
MSHHHPRAASSPLLAGLPAQRPELNETAPIRARAIYDGTEPVAEARALARQFLSTVQLREAVSPDSRDALRLVVSELVTNARTHTSGGYSLTLEHSPGVAVVSVWDTSPEIPAARPRDPRRIGGHGLQIVTSLCTSFQASRNHGGKRVSATLPLTTFAR